MTTRRFCVKVIVEADRPGDARKAVLNALGLVARPVIEVGAAWEDMPRSERW